MYITATLLIICFLLCDTSNAVTPPSMRWPIRIALGGDARVSSITVLDMTQETKGITRRPKRTSFESELMAEISSIKSAIQRVETRVENIETRVEKSDARVERVEVIVSNLQGAFAERDVELSDTRSRQRQHARHYVRSLEDLVKLVLECSSASTGSIDENNKLPRSLNDSFSSKRSQPSEGQTVSKHVDALLKNIFSEKGRELVVDALVTKMNVREVFASSFFKSPEEVAALDLPQPENAIESEIIKYLKGDKASRSYLLRSNEGLGVLLFSCCCGCPPVHEIEFDRLPAISRYGNREDGTAKTIIVEVQEVKSSTTLIADAVPQITQRLDILTLSSRLIHGNGGHCDIFKKCVVIVPRWGQIPATDANYQLPKPQGFDLVVRYV